MRISIFAKLALTFLVIVAGLLAFLGFSTSRELETSFSSLVEDREQRVARGIGLEVDLLLTGLENKLKGMADNFDLRRRLADRIAGGIAIGDRDLIARTGELRNIADIEWLWLVSPDGILLSAGHDPQAFGENLLESPGPHADRLRRALNGETVRAVAVESIAAENTFVAEVFLPIMISDRFLGREQVIGVLWGATRIDSEFMKRTADPAGGHLVALGESISPIASWQQTNEPMDPAMLEALVRGQSEINFRGETYGLATLPFPRSEAGDQAGAVNLHLLIPKSDLLLRRRTLLGSIIFEAIFGGLVAIFLAFIISKSITLPIEHLKTAVTELASGDLSRRVDVSSHDEVEDLVKAFNAMAQDLDVNTRRLVEAEKLSAWREVARRLAHEIKNPLSPIKLSIQNLVRVYRSNPSTFEPTLLETSDTILEEVDRLKMLADEFSNFARMPKPALVEADITEVLHGAASLFDRPEIGAKIEMRIADNLPRLLIDRDAMSRVLTNLLKNAVEAMQGRSGKITLGAEMVRRGDGRWIQVTVADEGVGMDEAALKQSFNPYFTTKRGGSGLGLAIVQSIVSEHGGRVLMSSELGKGTVVTIELPVVQNAG
jgi:signal transduction histidine kinase